MSQDTSDNTFTKNPDSHIHAPIPKKCIDKKLIVKSNPNLKSCLSPHDCFYNDEYLQSHTSFDIKLDTSPNQHGLVDMASTSSSTAGATASAAARNLHTPPPKTTITTSPHPLRVINLKSHDESFPSKTSSATSSVVSDASSLPPKKIHLLIGVTGCISAQKNVYLIIEKLFQIYTHEQLEVQLVLTEKAEWFLQDKLAKFDALGVKIWFHDDGTKYYQKAKSKLKPQVTLSSTGLVQGPAGTPFVLTSGMLSQYFLAYDLQKWTDVLLLAPLSANSMAKLTHGLADDLLSDILHLWPNAYIDQSPPVPFDNSKTILTNNLMSPKPIIAALALTTSMYAHPITKKQLQLLQETYPNMSILKPVEKCVDVDGNISMGGMRSWIEVVDFVLKKLGPPKDEDSSDDERQRGIDEVIAENDDGEDENEDDEEEDNDDDNDNDDDDDEDDNDDNDDVNENDKHNYKIDPTPAPTVEPKPIIQENKNIEKILRSRHNTLTRKELEENERLAEKNAIINSAGMVN